MFSFFARRRTLPPRISLCMHPRAEPDPEEPADPEAQVELVCHTLGKLGEVERLVRALPQLPMGDRQEILAQLASTADSLRSLYFLDAIY